MIESPETMHKFSENGLKLAEKYAVNPIIDNMLDVYKECGVIK